MKLKVETLYPIGSVVELKNTTAKVMITGFCVAKKDDDKNYYDYMGCIWPVGIIDTEKNFMFNHENIERLVFKGLENEEEKFFKEKLSKVVEEKFPQGNEGLETL